LEKGIKFPVLPQTTAVTTTLEPDRTAVAIDGISAFTAVTILVAAVVELVPTETCPAPPLVVTQVNVCVPTRNC